MHPPNVIIRRRIRKIGPGVKGWDKAQGKYIFLLRQDTLNATQSLGTGCTYGLDRAQTDGSRFILAFVRVGIW